MDRIIAVAIKSHNTQVQNVIRALQGARSSDFGRNSKHPIKFKTYLTDKWGKEIELENGIKLVATKVNAEEILIALAHGCEHEEVYLGITNDFRNEGFVGCTRVDFKFKMEMLPSYRYTPVLYGTVYA